MCKTNKKEVLLISGNPQTAHGLVYSYDQHEGALKHQGKTDDDIVLLEGTSDLNAVCILYLVVALQMEEGLGYTMLQSLDFPTPGTWYTMFLGPSYKLVYLFFREIL